MTQFIKYHRKSWMDKKIILLILTFLGAVLGFVAGFFLNKHNLSEEIIYFIRFPGILFMQLLRLSILPLISSSIITGVITFCIILGYITGGRREEGKSFQDFFASLNLIIISFVSSVIWLTPVGVASLICAEIAERNIHHAFRSVGLYVLCVSAGLFIHLIILHMIYALFVRKNPITFFIGMFQAFLTALATASSSATLPVSLECIEENNKVDKKISMFVLPIGAIINMDGTALYEAVAAIFIAQINGISLSIVQYFIISVTATLASIGAASIPSSGLITMIIVLESVNLPTQDISLILSVDWLLDRLRTSINVMGDSFGAAIVHHFNKEKMTESSMHCQISQPKISHDAYNTYFMSATHVPQTAPYNSFSNYTNEKGFPEIGHTNNMLPFSKPSTQPQDDAHSGRPRNVEYENGAKCAYSTSHYGRIGEIVYDVHEPRFGDALYNANNSAAEGFYKVNHISTNGLNSGLNQDYNSAKALREKRLIYEEFSHL